MSKFLFLFYFIFSTPNLIINSFQQGEKLFSTYCINCHIDRSNVIIPEKNLKKETLETFGINNKTSIVYQIINGKNGMPGFGGRLKQSEIEEIASYLLN
jgi:cytochrome c6